MTQTHEYGETKFFDVGSGAVGAESEEERKETSKKLEGFESEFASVKDRVMKSLGEVLSDARLSARMKSSPACLVGDENTMSLQMEQLMRAMGQTVPPNKRILELNPEHPMIRRLMGLARSDAAKDKVEDFVSVLYDQALILDGGTVLDPAKFSRSLADIMSLALEADKI
jgi:molecular chaperone HtpG